jgi:molybdate transport system substrate-binding protein
MRRAIFLVLLLAALAGSAAAATPEKITVYAASSLTNAFPAIDPNETYSFAGSSTLATQIRNGAPADVFASANIALPTQLYQQGLCSKPVVFARNRLVVVVPPANPAGIHSIYGLEKPGVKVDVAAPAVPVGTYTQQLLRNLHIAAAVNANVVSQETDVRTVLAHVVAGEVDAGVVYVTDAKSVPGQVKVIKVPAWAQPKVRYAACVVTASAHTAAAHAFIQRLLSPKGQATLHRFGFLRRVEQM